MVQSPFFFFFPFLKSEAVLRELHLDSEKQSQLPRKAFQSARENRGVVVIRHWAVTPDERWEAEACLVAVEPGSWQERSPWNDSQGLPSLPCLWGSGSWIRASSQCANRSQCIKLNTSVAPRRNLMSQNVLEKAPLFRSTSLGGIFLHTSCVTMQTHFPDLIPLPSLFLSLGPTLYHLSCAPGPQPTRPLLLGLRCNHTLTAFLRMWRGKAHLACFLSQQL